MPLIGNWVMDFPSFQIHSALLSLCVSVRYVCFAKTAVAHHKSLISLSLSLSHIYTTTLTHWFMRSRMSWYHCEQNQVLSLGVGSVEGQLFCGGGRASQQDRRELEHTELGRVRGRARSRRGRPLQARLSCHRGSAPAATFTLQFVREKACPPSLSLSPLSVCLF